MRMRETSVQRGILGAIISAQQFPPTCVVCSIEILLEMGCSKNIIYKYF